MGRSGRAGIVILFFFNDTATTEIYTLSLHDALPIYDKLKKENEKLKSEISKSDFLILENTQLRKLIDEQVKSSSNLVSSRVMLDEKSPYLNSFILNSGSNKKINSWRK